MTDDLRWAARYAFCEELWHGRARIVWDRGLESALTEGRLGDAPGDDDGTEPIAEMLEALLPRASARRSAARARGAAARIDVSMGVQQESVGRKLAPRRPATQFLTLGPLCDAIRRRDWAVALIDFSDLMVSDGPGESARLSVRGAELREALASRLTDRDRTAVVTVAAERAGATATALPGGVDPLSFGVDYDGLLEMVGPLLEGGAPVRIYGLLVPTMAAIVELGADEADDEGADERTAEVVPRGPASDGTFRVARLERAGQGRRLESEDDAKTAEVRPGQGGARRGSGAWRDGKPRAARWSDNGELEITTPVVAEDIEPPAPSESPADRDDDVPLSYDNTLGTQDPVLYEYIAVIGAGAAEFVAEGMTLVELPLTAPVSAAVAEASPSASLRAQLAQSRRQADLAAIERNGLVERLDDLESSNTTLAAEAAELRDRLARALAEAPESGLPDDPQRLDSARAEIQALRWELTQAQRALDAARARPVESLEAEVARLMAVLERRDAEAQLGPQVEAPAASGPDDAEVSPPVTGLSASRDTPPAPGPNGAAGRANGALSRRHRPAEASADTRALLSDVDALLQRVERADISALELRNRLLALRAALARQRPSTH